MLRNVERKILAFLRSPYRGFFVEIGPTVGDNDKIWTVSLNDTAKATPLVLLHGLGSGIAMWVMNYDTLAADRPVYAMDVLGFGRSSRPSFSNAAQVCEKQFVKSVEAWRRSVGIDNMILLGHSLGGFIATSYAISYPERVKHLILADPWGFSEKCLHSESLKQIPFWIRAVAFTMTPFNPLWALRAAGPFGDWMLQKARPDILRKFHTMLEVDEIMLAQYICLCNSQKPSGETAFHTMMDSLGWAKNPMVRRINDLRPDIPITFIYGSRSWIDPSAGEQFKLQRSTSFVDIKIIHGADHHVYADQPHLFNRYVDEACNSGPSQNQDPPLVSKQPLTTAAVTKNSTSST